MEDYYDDAEMPGSRLNIVFHGDRGASEQTFIIPFRDGDNIKYFVVRGVMGRQARDEMQHDQDNGLGSADQIPRGYLGGAMGRNAIQAEGRRGGHAVRLKPISQYPIFLFPIFRALPKKIRGGVYWDGIMGARGMADAGNEAVKKASGGSARSAGPRHSIYVIGRSLKPSF